MKRVRFFEDMKLKWGKDVPPLPSPLEVFLEQLRATRDEMDTLIKQIEAKLEEE